jgi:DNA-binding IclR family transcriptional regulator
MPAGSTFSANGMASHNVGQGGNGIYKLQALDRAFAVLDLLSASATSLGLAEIAQALGLHKSTAHRFLMVLQQHRMVERTPAGKFRLGLRLCDFGSRAIEQYDLRERAQLHLKMLVAEVEETAHLCILEQTRMVYIDKQEPERTIRMISRVGASSPVHCTAVGKAVLATMPRARVEQLLPELQLERFTRRTMTSREALLKELDRTSRRGYAVDDEEREEGVRCAGVAILDGRGEPVAAVSISGPAFRVTMQKIPQIAGKLISCVQGIQKDLGYVPITLKGRG